MLERRSILSMLLMSTFVSRLDSTASGGAAVLLVGSAGLSAAGAFSTRTLSVLPLDTRDINRATWVLAAGLPVLLLTAGRIISASVLAPFEDPWSWVFPVTPVQVFYECLLFAMVGAWHVLVPDSLAPDWGSSGLYLLVLGILGAMAVPFVVLHYLPATFAGISAMGWVLTGVAIALASTPLFVAPKQFARTAPPPPVIETAPAKLTADTVANGLLPAPRITGVWALMPRVMAQAVAWSAVFMTFHLVIDWTRGSEVSLQPFDPGMSGVRFLMVTSFVLLFVIGLLPSLGTRVPMLKLLPVPATRAAVVLTLAPVMTPLIFWGALILMHVAVSTAWPETLRLEYLVIMAGLAAAVDALGIKSGSEQIKAAIGYTILFVLAFAFDGSRAGLERMLQHWLVPTVGVASLALAYALNLHTMTTAARGSRAYRYGQSKMPQGAR